MEIVQVLLLIAVCLVPCAWGSEKKGVGMSMEYYQCGDTAAFTNVHWWYSWSMNPKKVTICKDSRKGFIPLKFKWYRKYNKLGLSSPDDDTILGFNEPNHASQANMKPEVAAADWITFQEKAGNRTLVSPAVAPGGYMDPVIWLKKFFESCDGKCKVNYIAVHAYYCTANEVMAFLQKVYANFKMKIWLTEFACPKTSSAEDQLEFMKQILPKLEESDIVHRYAWFVSRRSVDKKFVKTSASLLKLDKPELNVLGQYYNDYELPTK